MPKTPRPPTSPSLLPAARSLLKLRGRNNRKVGQARSTRAKGAPRLQVRRAKARPECKLPLKVLQRPRLNLTRINKATPEIAQCRRHGQMHNACMVRYTDLVPR